MRHDPKAYRAHSLQFSDWPLAHQDAWRNAFKKQGLFAKPNAARKWREYSITKTRKGNGIWLNWIQTRSGLPHHVFLNSRPEDLVTRDYVQMFVDDMSGSSASMTVYNHIQELYDTITNITPHLPKTEWIWLKTAWQNLRNEATPVRNKLPTLKEADQLEALGLKLMRDAEAAPVRNYRRADGLTVIQRALMYRDGLMVALLIRRPFRIKNFFALTIGVNFLIEDAGITFYFQAVEMKGKRSMTVPFPANLLPHLKRYIDHYRPILLTASAKSTNEPTDALWVSRDGTALTQGPLRVAIYKRTEQEFGVRIPPHWFRDAAVTTLIRDKPESAKLTSAILGHTDHTIVQKHYNQSQMIHASRRHYQTICELLELSASDTVTSA